MLRTFLYAVVLATVILTVVISADGQDYQGPWGEGVKCPYANPRNEHFSSLLVISQMFLSN